VPASHHEARSKHGGSSMTNTKRAETERALEGVAYFARALLLEVEKRHDTAPPPMKYVVPWGALVNLKQALRKLEPWTDMSPSMTPDEAAEILSDNHDIACLGAPTSGMVRKEGVDHCRNMLSIFSDT